MRDNPMICALSALSFLGAVTAFSLPTVAIDASEPELLQSGLSPSRQSTISEPIVAQVQGDVVDVVTSHGSFSTLLRLLEWLGLEEDLRGYGRFTVFAPTDTAFANLSPSVQAVLFDESHRELVAQILSYHMVSMGAPLYVEDITDTMLLRTLERSDIELQPHRSSFTVNGVDVIQADIEATNGVIHSISQVLVPPSIEEQLP